MKKTVLYNNVSLAYCVYGEGIPLVFIHGFGETNAVWKNQVSFLSKHFKLIVVDVPGSGASQLLPFIKNISIKELADAVLAIINNENIDQCIVFGHSMGGYITLTFAENYPEKIKAFGLINSTAFADSEEKKQNRLKGIELIENYGSHAFLKTTIPSLFSEAFRKEHAEVVNELIEEGRQFSKQSLQQYYYAMMQRPDTTSVIKKSKKPVLFVIGTEDVAAPLNDLLKQVHLAEIAYIHIIENIGHMSMLEAPDSLNSILKDFANACD
jgi:pimeloyl-ACP methyl ester carboxylesterase